jgi:hypothetical protein
VKLAKAFDVAILKAVFGVLKQTFKNPLIGVGKAAALSQDVDQFTLTKPRGDNPI